MVNPLNVSGLLEGGKADNYLDQPFLCVMNAMKKYVCGVQESLFFLMYS